MVWQVLQPPPPSSPPLPPPPPPLIPQEHGENGGTARIPNSRSDLYLSPPPSAQPDKMGIISIYDSLFKRIGTRN
jgi:hypothetical protein